MSEPELAALRSLFEECSLTGYEARLLMALLRLGSANASRLAEMTNLPRTSVYPVMDVLSSKGLAEPQPGKVTSWISPGQDVVLDRLYASQEERLEGLHAMMGQARQTLARLATEAPSTTLPHVQFLRGAPQVVGAYNRLLSDMRSELLMFTRGPFARDVGEPNPYVLQALERGVAARVLYQAQDIDDLANEAWLREVDAYGQAGVDGRVVDELPVRLVIFDQRIALVGLPDNGVSPAGYPTHQLIEHAGYAALQAVAFEQYWATSRPLFLPSMGRSPEPSVTYGRRGGRSPSSAAALPTPLRRVGNTAG